MKSLKKVSVITDRSVLNVNKALFKTLNAPDIKNIRLRVDGLFQTFRYFAPIFESYEFKKTVFSSNPYFEPLKS